MVTILLISDQDRLERLFDFVGNYPQIRFRVSRSLRQGTQDMAEEPSSLFFVQNHLSGLSGEIIARHLLGQVEGTRPRVVLFGEAGQQPSEQGPLDACLDITCTDDELTAAIIGIIAEAQVSQTTDAVSPSPPTEEPAMAYPGDEHAPSPVTSPDGGPSISEPPLPSTEGIEEGYSRATPPVLPSIETPFAQKLDAVMDETAEPVPLSELEDTVSLAGAPPDDQRTAKRRHVRRTAALSRSPLLWVGGVAAVAVAVGAVVLLSTSSAPTPAPSPKPAPPAVARAPEKTVTTPSPAAPAPPSASARPAVTPQAMPPPQQEALRPSEDAKTPPSETKEKGLLQLPPFIPRGGEDREYAKSHHGWERYRGARTEFKVYREGTVIRAVQAIDRSGVGIPETFFRGALNQMTNSREFTLDGKEVQGKFRVEKGTVTGGARLLIYRTPHNGSIRAFVVHFN